MCIYIYIYTLIHTLLHIGMCVCMSVCICVCIYIHVCMCVCMYIYIYMCVCIYTHVYTLTLLLILLLLVWSWILLSFWHSTWCYGISYDIMLGGCICICIYRYIHTLYYIILYHVISNCFIWYYLSLLLSLFGRTPSLAGGSHPVVPHNAVVISYYNILYAIAFIGYSILIIIMCILI